MAKFNPPGHNYGRRKIADTYPDVVGELARASRGLSAPADKRRSDRYPNIVGTQEQKRAADREVSRQAFKPPVDRPPGPLISRVPRIVVEGRYDDPRRPVRVPKLRNEDGSEWRPPVDNARPSAPRNTYPQIVGMVGVGRAKKFRPPHPKNDMNYARARAESSTQYVANCLGLTGEMLRSVLSYDPVMGELTWLRGSGPRTGQTVPHNPGSVLRYKGVNRNVFGVIYLMMLDRLPSGWVHPANGRDNDWSWDNIKPTERNRC